MRLSRISLVLLGALAGAVALSCGALLDQKDIFLADAEGGAQVGSDGGGPGTNEGGGGTTDSGLKSDAGACTSATTMMDPLNCGKCGHSCLGGACMEGACQPFALSKGQSPRDVVVDGKHVYWIEPNVSKAWQADKDGTNVVQLGGGTQNLLFGLAVDDKNVYWSSRDEVVLRCAIGGCTGTPTVVTSDGTFMSGVAVTATNVFWLEDPSGPNRIRSSIKTGMSNPGTTIATDVAGKPMGDFDRIATDGTFIYWTADDGKVRRVAASGGTIDVVGTGSGEALGLTVDGANVYWTNGDTPGTVYIAPKIPGGASAPLAAQQSVPVGIAVDKTNAYWVNAAQGVSDTSGQVMTCTIASCTPKPIAINQRTPVAVAVDDDAIYWSNFDSGNSGGGIMKLAK